MTKQCPECGQEIKETASYCPVCGSIMPFEEMPASSMGEQGNLAVQQTASSAEESKGKELNNVFQIRGADNHNTASAKEQVFTTVPQRPNRKWMLILAAGAAVLAIGLFGKGESKTENQIPEATDITPSELPESYSETEIEWIKPTIKENQTETISETTLDESKAMPEHHYEFIIKDCTWSEAFTEAALKGGYLVHFDTDEEYSAVKQELEPYETIKFWIGGCRLNNAMEYHWIHADGTEGPEILNSDAYSAYWLQNEPSFKDENLGKDEYYMNIFFYKKENRWVWNDVPDNIIEVMPNYAGKVGYIIEYDQ